MVDFSLFLSHDLAEPFVEVLQEQRILLMVLDNSFVSLIYLLPLFDDAVRQCFVVLVRLDFVG